MRVPCTSARKARCSPSRNCRRCLRTIKSLTVWYCALVENHSLTVVAPLRAPRGCPPDREGSPVAPDHPVIVLSCLLRGQVRGRSLCVTRLRQENPEGILTRCRVGEETL